MNARSPNNWLSWGDVSSWEILLHSLADSELDDVLVETEMLRRYSGLRTFHACRPIDITTYEQLGVLPMDLARLHKSVRELVRCGYSHISDSDIDKAIANTPKPSVPALVYSCVDEREMLRGGSHFHEYGSEHIFYVLLTLGDMHAIDYRDLVSNRGRPAILELGIPWVQVNDYVRDQLRACLPEAIRDLRNGSETDQRDWCQSQEEPVVPDHILNVRWL